MTPIVMVICSAWAGPFIEVVNVCDPVTHTVTSQVQCDTATSRRTSFALHYSILRPNGVMVFSAGPGGGEASINVGAQTWDSLGPVLPAIALSQDPFTTGPTECNGVNEFVPSTGGFVQSCIATGNAGVSGSPIACSYSYSNPGAPCEVVESDVYVDVNVALNHLTPTQQTGMALVSMPQVMAHEFGHVLGLDDDLEWYQPELVRLMDAAEPHGGDPGGDGWPGLTQSFRVGTAEFQKLLAAGNPAVPSYDNFLLYKWREDPSFPNSHVLETWTDTTASSFPWGCPQGAGNNCEHWYACRCECLQYAEIDFPRGPDQLMVAVNSVTVGPRGFKITYYLLDPGNPNHQACEDGLQMDLQSTPGEEGARTGSVQLGRAEHVGYMAKLCVPEAAIADHDYKICARITPIGGAMDDLVLDSVVYSDRVFHVTHGAIGSWPDGTTGLCAGDAWGAFTCP